MRKATFVFTIFLLIVAALGRSPMPDKTTDSFQNECLTVHNNYRALHNTISLTLDSSIVNYAKSRCNTISQSEALSAGHSGLQIGTYGENLYWSGGLESSATNAIKAWYDEIKYYSFANPSFGSAGHFTQLVWKSTTRLGCALCAGQGSTYFESYVVCNYQPAGNVDGQFAANVLPPTNANSISNSNQNPTTVQPKQASTTTRSTTTRKYYPPYYYYYYYWG